MDGEMMSFFDQLMVTRILLVVIFIAYIVQIMANKSQQIEAQKERTLEREIAKEAAEVRTAIRNAFPEAAQLMDSLETAQDAAWLKANPQAAAQLAKENARLRNAVADVKKYRESSQGRKRTAESETNMKEYLAKRTRLENKDR